MKKYKKYKKVVGNLDVIQAYRNLYDGEVIACGYNFYKLIIDNDNKDSMPYLVVWRENDKKEHTHQSHLNPNFVYELCEEVEETRTLAEIEEIKNDLLEEVIEEVKKRLKNNTF